MFIISDITFSMEKFILTGQSSGRQSKLVHLLLPSAKQFKPHQNNPYLLPPPYSVKEKTPVEKAELENNFRNKALDFRSRFKGHQSFHSETLDKFYSTHQYPVAQGPAVPPLDCSQHVLQDKTDHEAFIKEQSLITKIIYKTVMSGNQLKLA